MDVKGIVVYYNECNSVRQVAKKFEISPKSVLKILASNDVYPDGRATEIHRLISAGLTPAEIAERFKISEKTVRGYVPYNKGSYLNENKSKNALRIQAHRANTAKKTEE